MNRNVRQSLPFEYQLSLPDVCDAVEEASRESFPTSDPPAWIWRRALYRRDDRQGLPC